MSKNVTKTIDQVIDQIIADINNAVDNTLNEEGKVLVGLKTGHLNPEIERMKEVIHAANEILQSYCSFFKGKVASIETFMSEVLPIAKSRNAELEFKLKFVELNNIQIPGLARFNKGKLVESIDLTEAEQAAIDNLVNLSELVHDSSVPFKNLWDPAKKVFVLSGKMESDLREKHTVYADPADIAGIIYMAIIAQGVNRLSPDLTGQKSSGKSAIDRAFEIMRDSLFKGKLIQTAEGIELDMDSVKENLGLSLADLIEV